MLKIPANYISARERFLSLAKQQKASVTHFENTGHKGLEGEALFCDVATFGSKKAKKTLVISSGTHGVEGYCGSAIQCALMENNFVSCASDQVQIVFVHAINPYGFSHFRRVNEDNVDLNRNFVDFSRPRSQSEAYDELRSTVFPAFWQGSNLLAIEKSAENYIKKIGNNNFQAALTKGQYQHPDSPYFGGVVESWSRQIWEALCRDIGRYSKLVAHLDIHTGLGSSGSCELIFGATPNAYNTELANSWYGAGHVKIPGAQDSLSREVSGTLASFMGQLGVDTVGIGLEFGTVPTEKMLLALIGDNWLAQNPNCSEAEARAIRNTMKNTFFENNSKWLDSVWLHTLQHVEQTISGLTKA